MKRITIRLGKLFLPYCLLFGHDLNQPKELRVKKGSFIIRTTNVVYCKRCDKFIGIQKIIMVKTPIQWGQGKRNWGKICKVCLAKRGELHLYKECL